MADASSSCPLEELRKMSVIKPVPRSTVRLTPSAVAISIWTCVAGSPRAPMTTAAVIRSKGNAVETIAAEASLTDVVHRLGEKRIGALLVTDDGRIAGI